MRITNKQKPASMDALLHFNFGARRARASRCTRLPALAALTAESYILARVQATFRVGATRPTCHCRRSR